MKGISELITGIKAGYSYFYAQSEEINKTATEVQTSLEKHFSENEKGIDVSVSPWDFESTNDDGESEYNDPDTALKLLEDIQNGNDRVPPWTIVVAKNFQWFLTDEYGNFDKSKTSWLLNRAAKFSSPSFRKVLIIVGNADFEKGIPDILKRDFAKIEFPLPSEEEIEKLYEFIVSSAKTNAKFVTPTEAEKKRIISGARGLTTNEIVKVFSYSIIKNKGTFDPKTVEEMRGEEINGTPGLKIGRYDKKLDDLLGYEIAKEIVSEWIDDEDARGILLLGPAGVGKSHFCQALSFHYDRLMIEMEMAGLMGDGLVGQAEKAMKKALDVIAANANPNAPILLFIDEIEKGLAGTSGAGQSSGVNDGGTTDRSNAQFLKFLSDNRPKGVYVVATCNDIERLPAAFVRSGRWDTSPIFVDLPNKSEQEAILAHYQKTYDITARPKNMADWSGAEIQSWCKLARKKISKSKDANEADELIVPISKTMSREIDYLRNWSKGRTVPATRKLAPVKAEAKRSLTV